MGVSRIEGLRKIKDIYGKSKIKTREAHPKAKDHTMLSILQRQAALLEKELKEKQVEVAKLARDALSLRKDVEVRDIRISVLEAELAELKSRQSVESSVGLIKPIDENLDSRSMTSIQEIMRELTHKLESCEGKLSMTELRASMLSLQKFTQDVTHMTAMRDIEGKLLAAHSEIEKLRAAQAAANDFSVQASQLNEALARRDEQIEFLLQVHDASSTYEWVNDMGQRQPYAAGSGPNAVRSMGASSSGSPPRATGSPSHIESHGHDERSVRVIQELGASAEDARAALRKANGDLDRAVLSLYPS